MWLCFAMISELVWGTFFLQQRQLNAAYVTLADSTPGGNESRITLMGDDELAGRSLAATVLCPIGWR